MHALLTTRCRFPAVKQFTSFGLSCLLRQTVILTDNMESDLFGDG